MRPFRSAICARIGLVSIMEMTLWEKRPPMVAEPAAATDARDAARAHRPAGGRLRRSRSDRGTGIVKSWLARGLLAVLGSGAAVAGTAPEPAPSAPADPRVVVTQSLLLADVPTLAAIYRQSPDPVSRVLAAMALERIHFDLDKADEDARLCERELFASRPGIALFCARFANGNLRLAQGEGVAAAAELDIARRFAGRVPQAELDGMRRYVEERRARPPLRLQRPEAGFDIPLEHPVHDNRGAIEVEANGGKARLTVDTGASFLAMDADTARRLGVRMLGRSGQANGFLSRGVPVEYGVLDRLGFAGVVVENAPVEVLPGHARLIGIDVLRHLGTFRLTRDRIHVYGKAEPRPACQEPMLVASDVWGNDIRVVAALPIEGTLRTTLLDSGSSFYLSGDQTALGQLHATYTHRIGLGDIGPRRHAARVNEATAEVVISGQPIRMTFGVFKDARMRWDYVLGSGALDDMDFYFDFGGRHTCMLLHDGLR